MISVFRAAAICFTALVLGTAGLRAEGRDSARVYFFGNSLVHHLSDEVGTNVPQWLSYLASMDGREFAADGQWGFVRNFADTLPPEPNWSFPDVQGVFTRSGQEFGDIGLSAVVLTPANFIQYQGPDRPYDGDNPTGESPVQASVRLLTWVAQNAPGVPLYIYEGWAEMAGVAGGFPPSARGLRRYHDYNMGDYHTWFLDYRDQVAPSLPDSTLRLIPVASTLSALLSKAPLDAIDVQDLYSDDAPHGRVTLYFLAAMITYSALYEAPPPADIPLPDLLHPLVRDKYAAIADRIWGQVKPFLETEAATAPLPVATPEPAVATETPAVRETASSPDTGFVPALAMGMNGISDWSTQHPFINVMKSARPWIGHLPGQWGGVDTKTLRAEGHLDENGWPLRIPEGLTKLETLIFTDQYEDAKSLEGMYEVRYEGKGSLSITGRAERVQVKDGRGQFYYTPGEGLVSLSLNATDASDPIRNIAIFRTDQRDLFEAGALFNPIWLERVKDLRSVRFMDWMVTNGSPVDSWENRPRMEDYAWGERGVPMEVMVALANQIGADPWFNMPHAVGDDYIRNFATYVRDNLDPRLKAYVEYSNEVWNFIFPQAVYSRDKGEELWGKSDTGWMEYYGLRAAQVMDIWTQVFGPEAEARLVRVAATHSGWQGLEEYVLYSERVQEELGRPSAESFDAYAITGYFGFELGGDEYADQMRAWLDASEARATAEGEAQGLKRVKLREYVTKHRFDTANTPVVEALLNGDLKEVIEVTFPYHAGAAKAAGLDLIMYEGGTHVSGHGVQVDDDRLTEFFKQFNYTEDMGQMYQALIEGYTRAGGKLFNAFVDVSPATKWGSWGHLRHLDDSNPRWDALMRYNTGGDGGWQGRQPEDFANGLYLRGTDGPDRLEGSSEEDMMTGGAGDDVLVSMGGTDQMHGGEGNDVAILPGRQGDYTVTPTAYGIALSAGRFTVTLSAIERVEFADTPGTPVDIAGLR